MQDQKEREFFRSIRLVYSDLQGARFYDEEVRGLPAESEDRAQWAHSEALKDTATQMNVTAKIVDDALAAW